MIIKIYNKFSTKNDNFPPKTVKCCFTFLEIFHVQVNRRQFDSQTCFSIQSALLCCFGYVYNEDPLSHRQKKGNAFQKPFQIDVCIETVLKLDKSFLNNSCILESETLLIKVMLNSISVLRILKITHGNLSYAKVI